MLQADPAERKAPGVLARIGSVLLDHDPRDVVKRTGIAVLLYIAAVLGREWLHLLMPGFAVRYLTFFPALAAAGLLCGLVPGIALLAALCITGFFWIVPAEPTAPLLVHLALTFTFALAGAGVVLPAVYGVNAHRRLERQEEYLDVINHELRHRLKNLLSVTSSVCTSSLKYGFSQEEILRNIVGRIQAIASAQDFLSVGSNQSLNLRELVQAVVGPLCPDPARIRIAGDLASVPAGLSTSFALVLHELSTNAIKYGAWRLESTGTVDIAWRAERDRLWFSWREQGVQIPATQQRRGFGSRLFQTKFDGLVVDHKLHPNGAECIITIKR